MAVGSIGDLAASTMFRSHNARLQSEMNTLVQELTSGQVSIRDTALGSSYRAISGIERSLTMLDAYDLAATETEGLADTAQAALTGIQELTQEISVDLMAAGASATTARAEALVSVAREDFETVIARLNSDYAGRSVFAGVATDTQAVADASVIFAALETEIGASGATTAAEVAAVVDAWFDAPDGYLDIGYLGSDTTLAPIAVTSGRSVELAVTAQDQGIRDTLKGFAMAILVESAPVSSDPDQQIALAEMAGETLLNANQALLMTRAEVGVVQETIEEAQVEAQTERSAMDLALAELLTIDPYDHATQLEQVQSQIEMLYALTVRTSSLKLTNYL